MFFSPNPGTYAVIRMNPVAMVEDLNDPEALSAAEAIQTKAYVVYLKNVSDSREISFNINLVMLKIHAGAGDSVPQQTVVPLQDLSDSTLATGGGQR